MKIKNWKKFQHFKDRKPPWVKLYRDLLDDLDWHNLDPKYAKNLVMMWLIASEDKAGEGSLPDRKCLAFRLRVSEKELDETLQHLSDWVVQDDIKTISDGYQSDSPETETETETETNITSLDNDAVTDESVTVVCPHKKIVNLYHEVLPELPEVRVWSEERQKKLRGRWKEDQVRQSLDFWERFFIYVRESDFLMGNATKFQANLEWLVTSSSFIKIIEGKYHKREAV